MSQVPCALVVIGLLIAGFPIGSAAQTAAPATASPAIEVTPAPDAPRLELEFTELNDSGVTGTATLFDAGDRTIVELNLEDTGENHPAHIHPGTCDELNPEPAFPLENVRADGRSRTVVDSSLQALIDGEFAIDLHLSPNELGTLLVCADIEGNPTVPGPGGTPQAAATPASTPLATATAPAPPTATAPPTTPPTMPPTATVTVTEAATPTEPPVRATATALATATVRAAMTAITTAREAASATATATATLDTTAAPTTVPTSPPTPTPPPAETPAPTATAPATVTPVPTATATEAPTRGEVIDESAAEPEDGTGGAVNESAGAVSVPLPGAGDSGVTGTAVLTAIDADTTLISVVLSGDAVGGDVIVHLHDGTCDEPGAYTLDLNPVDESGISETEVDLALDELTNSGYFVNVHQSEEAYDTRLVCGELTNATVGIVAPEVTPADTGAIGTLDPTPAAVATVEPDAPAALTPVPGTTVVVGGGDVDSGKGVPIDQTGAAGDGTQGDIADTGKGVPVDPTTSLPIAAGTGSSLPWPPSASGPMPWIMMAMSIALLVVAAAIRLAGFRRAGSRGSLR